MSASRDGTPLVCEVQTSIFGVRCRRVIAKFGASAVGPYTMAHYSDTCIKYLLSRFEPTSTVQSENDCPARPPPNAPPFEGTPIANSAQRVCDTWGQGPSSPTKATMESLHATVNMFCHTLSRFDPPQQVTPITPVHLCAVHQKSHDPVICNRPAAGSRGIMKGFCQACGVESYISKDSRIQWRVRQGAAGSDIYSLVRNRLPSSPSIIPPGAHTRSHSNADWDK